MSDSINKTGTYSLQYGVLLGIITMFFNLMLFILDQHYQGGSLANFVNSLIMIIVIVFGQMAFKKNNNNLIKLSECIKIGLGISLISSIIGLCYYYILTNFLDPDTTEKALSFAQDQLILANPRITQKELDNIAEISRNFSGFGFVSTMILIFSLFFGLIFSIISGLFIKSSKFK